MNLLTLYVENDNRVVSMPIASIEQFLNEFGARLLPISLLPSVSVAKQDKLAAVRSPNLFIAAISHDSGKQHDLHQAFFVLDVGLNQLGKSSSLAHDKITIEFL